jgi:hypothetical protein
MTLIDKTMPRHAERVGVGVMYLLLATSVVLAAAILMASVGLAFLAGRFLMDQVLR